MRRIVSIIICIAFTKASFAQSASESYYRMPVDIPVFLSGNFAEMRSGHLHSGIDIKTEGREGITLRAVADGTVSRVVVNPAGFGRALYIDHPNGTTTVYGHLLRFTPDIEEYLASERYRLQSDKVDLEPAVGRFRFKKGEIIGYSGNSGMSGGPHLHFELRDTPSQRTLNPVASGAFPNKDDIAPTIFRLFYIQVDTIQGVPVNARPREIKTAARSASSYTVTGVVPVSQNGYFVVEAIDYKNGTQNRMGIYRIAQSIDGEVNTEQRRDNFLFSDTRYVNAIAHYGLKRTTSNEMIRMAVMTGNKIPIYSNVRDRGAIVLTDTLKHVISIEIEDDSRNVSRVEFVAQKKDFPLCTVPAGSTAARHDKVFSYSEAGAGITIPAGALYEPIYYTQAIFAKAVTPPQRYSPVHSFHNEDTPLHSAATFWIAAQVPAKLRSKATLAKVAQNGAISYAGGSWTAATSALPERVTAQLREFGRYCVVTDTIPPKITPSFANGADLTGKTALSFTIKDEFPGIKSYRATIDGRWALMEYDIQQNSITHPFDPTRLPLGGTHTIILEVVDNLNNKATYKGSFIIKNKKAQEEFYHRKIHQNG